MFRSLSTCVLLLLFALPGVALAQGTGTLAGRVLDGTSNEGLPGANVLVEGTSLGAATDIDGNYRIIGVPVGSYTITASYAGYEPFAYDEVSINNGYTRELDFTLSSGQLGEIEVVYERPIIQKDAIGAPRVVGAEDIENLPVRGVGAVTALQGSVVEGADGLNVRGGRAEEIQYYVDGVKVSGLVGVNQQAIQEQEMLIGSIPARYGDVQSGVVSITTKTGRQDFFGSLEAITSRGLDSYGYNLGSLSLGGPVIPGKVGFFLSGEALYQDDANPYGVSTYTLRDDVYDSLQLNPQTLRFRDQSGAEVQVPFPVEFVDGPRVNADSIQARLFRAGMIPDSLTLLNNGALIPRAETFTADDFDLNRGKDNELGNYTLNGNLNFDVSSAVNLRLGAGYSTRDADERSFTSSLYNRNAYSRDERDSYRLYGTFRQRVSDQAFYQLQGEFQDFQYVQYPNGFARDGSDLLRYGDVDDFRADVARRYFIIDGDGNYAQQFVRDGGSRPGRVSPQTFSLPGRDSFTNNYQKSHNQQFRFSGNATTQVGVHQIEFGGEYEQEARRFYSINAFGLAAFAADGELEQAAPEGFPNGVTAFEQLPYEQIRNRATYYGYNYLGTEEVNDQDIDNFFDNENRTLEAKNLDAYRPIYYAGYISDKIEYQDIVITAGLRVDVFDNNTDVLIDSYAPVPIIRAGELGSAPSGIEPDYAVYFAADQETVLAYRDLEGNFFDAEGTETTSRTVITELQAQVVEKEDAARSEAFEAYEAQVTVMPRVGVSFPVTDRALFFASYDVVSQRPTEQGFAPISFFDDLSNLSFRTPNGKLEPETTTQYQLGFRQRLGERAAISLAGFYRTQENKITNRVLNGSFPQYGTYVNQDFTTTQGAELTFDLRRTNNLALTANYTLQYAQGTGSDAGATANIVWRGNYFPQFISPADFDQRHTANVTLDYRLGEGEGPLLGGIHALENFGINLIGQFGSGQRYTRILPNTGFSTGESFTTDVIGTINSTTLPATSRLDMRIDRAFNLGFSDSRFRAYILVQNLLDTRNVLAVYRGTGQPDNDGYPITAGGQTTLNTPGRLFNYDAYAFGPVNNGGNQASSNGTFYGSPRQIRLGLLFDF